MITYLYEKVKKKNNEVKYCWLFIVFIRYLIWLKLLKVEGGKWFIIVLDGKIVIYILSFVWKNVGKKEK
jgi:hypothetical protein